MVMTITGKLDKTQKFRTGPSNSKQTQKKACHGSEIVCTLRFIDPWADFDLWSNGPQLMIYEHLD